MHFSLHAICAAHLILANRNSTTGSDSGGVSHRLSINKWFAPGRSTINNQANTPLLGHRFTFAVVHRYKAYPCPKLSSKHNPTDMIRCHTNSYLLYIFASPSPSPCDSITSLTMFSASTANATMLAVRSPPRPVSRSLLAVGPCEDETASATYPLDGANIFSVSTQYD